jgi:hypothetical protein
MTNAVSHCDGVFVLPHAKDTPSLRRQRGIDRSVAAHVSFEFRKPVIRVGPRRRSMLRAPVPEATVDEDREPGACEDHIGTNGSIMEAERKIDSES